MSSDWIRHWTIYKIKSVICTGDDLLQPFTIHSVIKKINERYLEANAYYSINHTSRSIRQALSELIDEEERWLYY